jgi:hypothetical protein
MISDGPVEKLLIELGERIESGIVKRVFNVSASTHALYITVAYSKSWKEVGGELSFCELYFLGLF